MNISDLESMDDNGQQKKAINYDENFRTLIVKLRELHVFLDHLDFLMIGRDFQIIKGEKSVIPFSIGEILLSSVRTIDSLIMCCEVGNFGDVYTLLRKLRDNLFFYLYVLEVSNSADMLSKTEMTEQEKYIKKWLQNKLTGLTFNGMFQFLCNSTSLKPAIEKYNFEVEFKKINKTLNNYVHSNGVKYLNHPIGYYFSVSTESFSEELYSVAERIMISFIFFLILLRGDLVASSDYVEALEFQQTPEEGSQYWVAPFVKEFVQNHIGVLGEDCGKFLKEATFMEI